MASFMLLGLVADPENESVKHLAILANTEKRADFLDALKEAIEQQVADEVLCIQGSVLPLKIAGNKIEAIEISRVEYPLDNETKAEYTSTPVFIKGDE